MDQILRRHYDGEPFEYVGQCGHHWQPWCPDRSGQAHTRSCGIPKHWSPNKTDLNMMSLGRKSNASMRFRTHRMQFTSFKPSYARIVGGVVVRPGARRELRRMLHALSNLCPACMGVRHSTIMLQCMHRSGVGRQSGASPAELILTERELVDAPPCPVETAFEQLPELSLL